MACGLNDLLLLAFHSYRYEWLMEETEKNVLRTHTTAVSARMLYKLAQQVSVGVGVASCSKLFSKVQFRMVSMHLEKDQDYYAL